MRAQESLQRALIARLNASRSVGANPQVHPSETMEFCSNCGAFHPAGNHVGVQLSALPSNPAFVSQMAAVHQNTLTIFESANGNQMFTGETVQPDGPSFNPCDILIFEFANIWMDVMRWNLARLVGFNANFPAAELAKLEAVLDGLFECLIPVQKLGHATSSAPGTFANVKIDLGLCLERIFDKNVIRTAAMQGFEQGFLDGIFADGMCLFGEILKAIPSGQ